MSEEGALRLARRIEDELAALAAAGLERRLRPRAGVDFASNDYLGLASDRAFRGAVVRRLAALLESDAELFAPSARLLRGQTELHARTESRLAAFKGAEAALLFPSGWQANAALLTGLLRSGDVVVSDALNHASLIDGMRLTRAERVVVPHLDLRAWARELDRSHRGGEVFVVVESLYSMEGDLAPLAELAALCSRFEAHLLVDDAHATGVYGTRGAGALEAAGVERQVTAAVTTFGKALAISGAAVTGSKPLIDLLISRARPFLFSTAISPLLLVALGSALDVVVAEPQRRARLHANAKRLRARLADAGQPVAAEGSPIVPLVVGDSGEAMAIAQRVQAKGFDVRAVRPPTVPDGTARLRVSVHADRTEAEIDGLAAALAAELG